MTPIRWSDAADTALGVVLGLAIGAAALGALIVSQVQLHEARGEVHRLRALLSDVTKWRQDW